MVVSCLPNLELHFRSSTHENGLILELEPSSIFGRHNGHGNYYYKCEQHTTKLAKVHV